VLLNADPAEEPGVPLAVNVSSGAVAMNPCKLIWVGIVTV
jgi:hypothetical protein